MRLVGAEPSSPRPGAASSRCCGCRAVLVTRGEHGMSLFERGRAPLHVPAAAREVFDVTGRRRQRDRRDGARARGRRDASRGGGARQRRRLGRGRQAGDRPGDPGRGAAGGPPRRHAPDASLAAAPAPVLRTLGTLTDAPAFELLLSSGEGGGDEALAQSAELPGKDALAAMRRAAQAHPEDPDYWFMLGGALAHRGEHEAAIGAFREALRFPTAEPAYRRSLGGSLWRLGRFEEARRGLRRNAARPSRRRRCRERPGPVAAAARATRGGRRPAPPHHGRQPRASRLALEPGRRLLGGGRGGGGRARLSDRDPHAAARARLPAQPRPRPARARQAGPRRGLLPRGAPHRPGPRPERDGPGRRALRGRPPRRGGNGVRAGPVARARRRDVAACDAVGLAGDPPRARAGRAPGGGRSRLRLERHVVELRRRPPASGWLDVLGTPGRRLASVGVLLLIALFIRVSLVVLPHYVAHHRLHDEVVRLSRMPTEDDSLVRQGVLDAIRRLGRAPYVRPEEVQVEGRRDTARAASATRWRWSWCPACDAPALHDPRRGAVLRRARPRVIL